jgi:predicted ATP-grasp superfamily ATP-dependent carboligase
MNVTPGKPPESPGQPPKWRVLVFPGATEIAMELRQALAWCKEVMLFSAGSPVSNHAPFVFARHFMLPAVSQPLWLEELSALVEANQITHIFPAHDETLLSLAENASMIKAKIVTSSLETCRLTRSKTATLRRLAGAVPTPELFQDAGAVKTWPVFLKPDRGQGSQRTALGRNADELGALLMQDADRIILEYLEGPEFTVDCFSDREQGLQYVCGRQRRRIRAGIAMDSAVVADSRFWEYAEKISKRIELHGAWFFQVKADRHGVFKVMEVAPRIGGTSALSRVHGVNLPLLSLYESERLPVRITPGDYSVEIDRALVNRYRHNLRYRTLYVDFDDTLVIRGILNVELVKLLFQGINRGVRLVLLTRHKGDLKAQLRRWRVENLFDEIIHLGPDELKANFIKDKDAVLIDDSFAERNAVHEKTGIVTLDPSMIELLLEDCI